MPLQIAYITATAKYSRINWMALGAWACLFYRRLIMCVLAGGSCVHAWTLVAQLPHARLHTSSDWVLASLHHVHVVHIGQIYCVAKFHDTSRYQLCTLFYFWTRKRVPQWLRILWLLGFLLLTDFRFPKDLSFLNRSQWNFSHILMTIFCIKRPWRISDLALIY